MTKPLPDVNVGTIVRRIEGRPANIGRVGTVLQVGRDVVGSAGDILIRVRDNDGSEWSCYTRQVVVVA